MDDRSIIALFFARDERAIAQTQQKYGKVCLGLARRVLGNEQDAEECVNDAYAGLWNAIPPASPDDLCAFACRVVRNLSLKRLRALTRQKCSRDMTVSFSELEEILSDEAVDGREGEIAAAIIEIKEGETCTEDEINQFCLALPRYKRPRKIFFEKVPRNPTGKIEKPVLREKYCKGRLVEAQITG